MLPQGVLFADSSTFISLAYFIVQTVSCLLWWCL